MPAVKINYREQDAYRHAVGDARLGKTTYQIDEYVLSMYKRKNEGDLAAAEWVKFYEMYSSKSEMERYAQKLFERKRRGEDISRELAELRQEAMGRRGSSGIRLTADRARDILEEYGRLTALHEQKDKNDKRPVAMPPPLPCPSSRYSSLTTHPTGSTLAGSYFGKKGQYPNEEVYKLAVGELGRIQHTCFSDYATPFYERIAPRLLELAVATGDVKQFFAPIDDPISGRKTSLADLIVRIAKATGQTAEYMDRIKPMFGILDRWFGERGRYPNREVYSKAAIALLHIQRIASPDGAAYFFSRTNAAENIIRNAVDSGDTLRYLTWFYFAAQDTMRMVKKADEFTVRAPHPYRAGGYDCDRLVCDIVPNIKNYWTDADKLIDIGLAAVYRVRRPAGYGHWAFGGVPYIEENGQIHYVLGATHVKSANGKWEKISHRVWHYYAAGQTSARTCTYEGFKSWDIKHQVMAFLAPIEFNEMSNKKIEEFRRKYSTSI
ncbi:MAG: hypothetical protein QXP42_02750 [Candidatus Micrarchaeia archaeon]